MPFCSVFGCSNSSKTKKPGEPRVSFHTFPNRDKSPKRFKLWLDYCHRKKFTPSKHSTICSRHFKESDFDNSQLLKIRLMPNFRVGGPKLNPGSVPSVPRDTDNPPPKKSCDREERFKKKHQKEVIECLLSEPSTSTQTVEDPDEPEEQAFSAFECSANDSFVSSDNEEGNNKSVQCELGKEVFRLETKENIDLNESFYEPQSDALSSDSDYSDSEPENPRDDIKHSKNSRNFENFFISWDCISQFFQKCSVCCEKITNLTKSVYGTALVVKTECEKCGRKESWTSQRVSHKRPHGNILMTSALVLSGILHSSFKTFCELLDTPSLSHTTYNKIIKTVTGPVIKQLWVDERMRNVQAMKKSRKPIWLAGDGQYDSPGFSAKYMTYSVMDLHSQKVVDFEVVQKGMIKGELEKPGCDRMLEKLVKTEKCDIKLFLTDRHKGVRWLLRTKYPEITHEFDVWHLSKSLMKKFKGFEKKYPKLHLWKPSINNHLWYCAQSCNGDGDLLVEKFISILYHIKNQHTWKDGRKKKKCEHGPLSEIESRKKLWVKGNSEEYRVLKKIILNKSLLKDLRQLKHFVHTGKLESYHNVRLKYMPKRIHFSYEGMFLRSTIAAMDHNNNLGKKKIGEKKQFSKATKSWTLKSRYSSCIIDWKKDAIQRILSASKAGSIPQVEPLNLTLPKNIAPFSCPSVDILRKRQFSRFPSKK